MAAEAVAVGVTTVVVAEAGGTAAVVAEARTAVAEAVLAAVGEGRAEAVLTATEFLQLQPALNFGAGFFLR